MGKSNFATTIIDTAAINDGVMLEIIFTGEKLKKKYITARLTIIDSTLTSDLAMYKVSKS